MLPVDIGSVAIDTNVIIYALADASTNPKTIVARRILLRAGRTNVSIGVSARHAMPSRASSMTSRTLPPTADSTRAIIAAAAAGGCGALLSEHFQDQRRFDPPDVARRILIVNPFVDANRDILTGLGALGESID